MTDEQDVIDQTLSAIFARHADRDARAVDGAGFPSRLWAVLDEAGMTSIGDADNDAGLDVLVVVARALGRAAAAVPLVETAGLSSWLLSSCGVELPTGITTSSSAQAADTVELTRVAAGWQVRGRLHRVPWGRDADHVATVAVYEGQPYAVLAPVDVVTTGANLAGEPRDTLRLDAVLPSEAVAAGSVTPEVLRRRGAVLRAAAMVGAMESARDLSLTYSDDREQFGRPISTFQAVQHHLVAIAEETLCAGMAVQLAVVAGEDSSFAAAAAKATAGTAAAVVTRRAHQVHAAIGVTMEHSLPWFTKRLWAWQDEFGSTREWTGQLGREVLATGPERLWPTISATVGAARAPELEEVSA